MTNVFKGKKQSKVGGNLHASKGPHKTSSDKGFLGGGATSIRDSVYLSVCPSVLLSVSKKIGSVEIEKKSDFRFHF